MVESSIYACLRGTRVSKSLGRCRRQHGELCISVMQPKLFYATAPQQCPAVSDYYGGWRTLLFLTAGSTLNELKRIFRSSCFRKAFKAVATTDKAVCFQFGGCLSTACVLPCSYKREGESFFHKYCKLLVDIHPDNATTAFQDIPFHHIRKHRITPVLLEGSISIHSLFFTYNIES